MGEPIQILNACIAAFFLWALWQYGWKVYALDLFRQKLFSIRADLFELAATNPSVLPFGGKSYSCFRGTLNARIRFAHKISFIKVLFGSLAAIIPGLHFRETVKSYKNGAEIAIETEADPAIKKRLIELNEKSMYALMGYLMMTSLVFAIAMVLAITISVCVVIICNIFLKKEFWMALKQMVETNIEPTGRVIDFQAETCEQDGPSGVLCPA